MPSRRRFRPRSNFSTRCTLTACSLCLRVLQDGEWIEAATAIVELRSFEHQAAPQLEPALCAHCAEAIDRRRLSVREPLAA